MRTKKDTERTIIPTPDEAEAFETYVEHPLRVHTAQRYRSIRDLGRRLRGFSSHAASQRVNDANDADVADFMERLAALARSIRHPRG